jgi:hypothetical protein
MSHLVNDFNCFNGRDVEMVVKELAAVYSHLQPCLSMSLRNRTHGKKCLCLTRELIKLSIMVATEMIVIYCIQSYKMCFNVRHHRLLHCIALDLRKLHLLVI